MIQIASRWIKIYFEDTPVIGFIRYNLIFSSWAARHSGVMVWGASGPTKFKQKSLWYTRHLMELLSWACRISNFLNYTTDHNLFHDNLINHSLFKLSHSMDWGRYSFLKSPPIRPNQCPLSKNHLAHCFCMYLCKMRPNL